MYGNRNDVSPHLDKGKYNKKHESSFGKDSVLIKGKL